ncbi:MAG: methyltransferase domain-containing protein [Candidatus Palauibacterales bacterium]|nr:methyltransferase domain-containing protein [Candidatus Palauibacterales bacterium]MDP2529952.1 methyltransferase domain-containing protein [Candidatus Palauibacterales bacterium]MDP2583372.1 methyltransferase domain-containing protein [Candidatus Palauibacterales bacterium]
MSLFYRLAYALGVTPWEKATDTHGHLIAPLLYREEAGCELPYGPALDLGCGAGYWAVELARRGWEVTGIDSVPKALRRARARTRAAGVEVRFVQGDVTRLEDAGVGSGFRFLYDLGCFHGLTDEERVAMGRGVSAVAAPDATLLELVWRPGRRGPLPRGASPEDLEAAFVGWKVMGDDPLDATALPGPLRDADPRCYRLRRVA